jgi:hypothetical protein
VFGVGAVEPQLIATAPSGGGPMLPMATAHAVIAQQVTRNP